MGIVRETLKRWGLAKDRDVTVLEDMRPPLPPSEEDKEKDLSPSKAKELAPVYGVAWDDSMITSDMHPSRPVTFSSLREISRIPAVASIIRTRTNQVAEFAHPARREGDTGFLIEPIDFAQEITPEVKQKCLEITKWMTTCGDPACGHGDNFESFLRKLVPDSLELDQGCFEIRRTYAGDVAGFQAVDSATIRFATPTKTEYDHMQLRESMTEEGQVVQVVDNKIVAQWSREDLAVGIRNPQTQIDSRGYGDPELFILVAALSWMVDAEIYNAASFKNGAHAKGILALKSNMPRNMFQQLRREYFAMLKGPKNAHKTLFLQLNPNKEVKEELQYLNMSRSNQEMEFAQWLGYLQKLTAAVFQMDPAEINFVYGSENQSGGLQQSSGASRVEYSREKGLRPLLRAIESWLNKWVLNQKFPGYRIRFVGLDHEQERKRIEDLLKQTKVLSINEIRAKMGYAPITEEMEKEGAIADLPADAQYMHGVVSARQHAFTEDMAEAGYDAGGSAHNNPVPKTPQALSGEEDEERDTPEAGERDTPEAGEQIFYGPHGGQYADPQHKTSISAKRREDQRNA